MDAPRRVTVMTVAEAAQVSRQTVTNTMLHPERVHPETLARVRAEIDRLGYRPSAAATSLRASRAGAVGIELNALGADYHNALMTPFLAALSVHAGDFDMHMVTFGSASSEPELAGYQRMWATGLVDAFVIADTHHGDPRPGWLDEQRIPYVSFGRVWDDPTFTHWVDVDGHAGTALAVDHCRLVGYSRIGYLGCPTGHDVVGDDRRQGWADACKRHGAAVAGPSGESGDELAEAAAAALPVVAQLGPGDAVVCGSDVYAVGALHAVRRLGLEPGRDIGIVGFDDSELARMHGLSSIAQPVPQIAQHTLRLVGRRLAGPVADPRTGPHPTGGGVLLRPDLTRRSSSAR